MSGGPGALLPDRLVSVREVFGIDTNLVVPAFAEADEHVPEIDQAYRFNPDVTIALLAGPAYASTSTGT
jgi:cobaltochelatase CobS